MLRDWQSDADYQTAVEVSLSLLNHDRRQPLKHSLKDIHALMCALKLDPVRDYMADLYSDFGRPAKNQPTIIRSLILKSLLSARGLIVVGLTNWINLLSSNPLYCALLGYTSPLDLPPLGSYYDLMDRLWASTNQFDLYARNKVFPKRLTSDIHTDAPSKEDGKLPERNKHLVDTLCKKLRNGEPIFSNFEKHLEMILVLAGIRPSIQAGVIPSVDLIASGDGTAVYSKSSYYGHRLSSEKAHMMDPDYQDSGLRHLSDPDARWGYDSDKKKHYFGFTLYSISHYNPSLKVDVPLITRFFGAQRHDSVSLLVTLQDLRRHAPELNIKHMPLDSAHDALPIYELLDSWDIISYIDINKRKASNEHRDDITINTKGTPFCAAGYQMYHCGFNPQTRSTKWRCPFAAGKVPSCPCTEKCHQKENSTYGRTIYLPCEDNLRLYPRVPRETEKYRNVYSTRTTSERINKRILVDYKMADSRTRNIKHYSVLGTIICICIHLEAQVKALSQAK